MTARIVSAVRPVVITGGAGFIGSNLAHRLLSEGQSVLIFDNLSRPGVEQNLRWLRARHAEWLEVVIGDVRDAEQVRGAVRRASAVYHFAAQVAVTSSLLEPRFDFEVNALGTLNVIEALREAGKPTPLLFTSTNKVYGAIDDVELGSTGERYQPLADAELNFDEQRALDFHSPYGCSKGSADQYVRDYARSFGMPAVVFRMSCIYGPRQFGTEDQGWVAHFLLRALAGDSITIFGDGKQGRDVLFVEDLIEAMLLASRDATKLSGRAFNIGGGARNTVSLLELLDSIERLTGRRCIVDFEPARVGDQRYYVSQIAEFTRHTGWQPKISVERGVARLAEWLSELKASDELAVTGKARR